MYAILLSYGHDGVPCDVRILPGLLLLAVMVTKAAIMMTMALLMTKMMAAMVMIMMTVLLMMMAMLVLCNLLACTQHLQHLHGCVNLGIELLFGKIECPDSTARHRNN